MRRSPSIRLATVSVMSLILMATVSSAQELPKRIFIQAQAMGTSTQMGRQASVNLTITKLTSNEERAG